MSENGTERHDPPQIELIDVSQTYGDDVSVLRDVSLTVEAGESLAIVGPSGCGKSTLLNIIGGLMRPSAGRVRFDRQDLGSLDDRQLASFRSRHLGFVFQSHHLLPQCSALENVLVPSLVHPDVAMKQSAGRRGRALLDRMGLADRMNHRPGQLSGGECQRVAVARALINEPSLVLADEPTGSLDEDAAGELAELLVTLNRDDGVTLLTVTHAPTLAGRLQRRLRLMRGRLETVDGS